MWKMNDGPSCKEKQHIASPSLCLAQVLYFMNRFKSFTSLAGYTVRRGAVHISVLRSTSTSPICIYTPSSMVQLAGWLAGPEEVFHSRFRFRFVRIGLDWIVSKRGLGDVDVCWSVYLFIYLSVCLFIYLSIYIKHLKEGTARQGKAR